MPAYELFECICQESELPKISGMTGSVDAGSASEIPWARPMSRRCGEAE